MLAQAGARQSTDLLVITMWRRQGLRSLAFSFVVGFTSVTTLDRYRAGISLVFVNDADITRRELTGEYDSLLVGRLQCSVVPIPVGEQPVLFWIETRMIVMRVRRREADVRYLMEPPHRKKGTPRN